MLKRLISGVLMTVIISCVYLYAPEGPRNQEETAIAQTVAEHKEQPSSDWYMPNDLHLTEVGQSIVDFRGKLTLLADATEIAPIVVGPLEFTIKDVKVVQFVPNNSAIGFFQSYTKQLQFDLVKMRVEIHNTSSDTIQFTPITHLETNDGEQKTKEDNLFLEEINGNFAGGEIKQGNIGFILNEQAGSILQGIHIFTSDAVNTQGMVFERGKKVDIHF